MFFDYKKYHLLGQFLKDILFLLLKYGKRVVHSALQIAFLLTERKLEPYAQHPERSVLSYGKRKHQHLTQTPAVFASQYSILQKPL